MNEAIVEGNCGELCNYHCCRSHESDETLGMYLLPEEYEAVQKHLAVEFEVHASYQYELPVGTKKLYYIFCNNDSGCLRSNRPIQCRTYPLEPHLIDGQLTLIVEKNQLHVCPLIEQTNKWRPEFLEGVYKGWTLLLTLEKVRMYIDETSKTRQNNKNIYKQFDQEDIFNWS